jgi:hypothetical protein
MFDDLAAFFHENVVTAFTDYAKTKKEEPHGRSRDLRAAITAATALYHLREHVPTKFRKSREQIAKLCPDYDLLGDIVNAAKHRELKKGTPQINSAEDVFELTVVTRYEDDQGEYSDTNKLVVVKLKDGSERDVSEVLTNVINFWGQELTKHQVLPRFKPFPLPVPPGSRPLTRADAKQRLDQEIIRGVRFKHMLRLQKYNSTTGKSEPIDLTGSQVHYRIYKPAYSIDIELTGPAGEKVKTAFDLTDEQSMKWHEIETDEERRAFVQALVKENKEEVQRLIAEAVEKGQSTHSLREKQVFDND